MNKVAEFASGAAGRPMEVPAWYGAVVAGLDQEALCGSSLLLLGDDCVHSRLRLLLLSSELSRLNGCEMLLLLQLVFNLYLIHRVLDHLQKLLVRHARVVTQQVHDLLALAYKQEKVK